MAVNSSSSSNDSLLYSNPTFDCIITRPSSLIFFTFYITSILLFLPLFILVLYLGLQRWRQQRSTSSAAVMSHSDSFTYHMTSIELINVLGFTLWSFSVYWEQVSIFNAGYFLSSFSWYGQMFFHMLTCVEHYLAVVHPITYLSLKGERGIRIRNISIGCVFLLCIGATSLAFIKEFLIMDFSLLIFSLIAITFCSLSVLCVLIRPGPGEKGGERERVDQTKRRAFVTIVAILGVLLLRCFFNLVWAVGQVVMESNYCVMMTAGLWFNAPSSLVLPLLFLHRLEKIVCCKNNT